LVRIIDISNVDIANIKFDYDLVFAVMFMNGNGQIYSRYGGRTPWNSESRVSVEGLCYTMRCVLNAHTPALRPVDPPNKPIFARELASSKRSCMHCHEVWEGLRRRAKHENEFDPSSLFVYPRPENIGLTLDVDEGNVVVDVKNNSPCEQAGIRPGDKLSQIGNSPIYSQADVSWALHNSPDAGQIPVQFTRNETKFTRSLTLEEHWKESKLSWRASMSKEDSPTRHNRHN
jgi:hypothetical protein